MTRLVLVAALVAGACGAATDDRPPTLDFITETILAPTCAGAECHSAYRRAVGDQFDTVEATRRTIVAIPMVNPTDVADPSTSFLIQTLTVGQPSVLNKGVGNVRMPYDAPMPDADIELIRQWIRAGFHGAQCVPSDQGRGCSFDKVGDIRVDKVVECPDGDIGADVMVCPVGQHCNLDRNGQCAP